MLNWFMNQSLVKKQVLVLLLGALTPMLLVGLISLQSASQEIKRQAFNQLEAVREIKSAAVQRYFKTVESQLITMASSAEIINASSSFSRSFGNIVRAEGYEAGDIDKLKMELRDFYVNEFGNRYQSENNGKSANIDTLLDKIDNEAIVLQHAYIYDNQNKLGEKHLLTSKDGRSVYHRAHANYHPGIRKFLEEFSYYDIFIVDAASGDIVYSVFKELDYATSLIDGPYANSNIASVFDKARLLEKGQVAIEDFSSYTPSYEAPASFAASPIYDGNNLKAVLIFQMPLEPINAIMTERSGMGETGESYLVGSDYLMRSDSYLDPINHTVSSSFKNPGKGHVKTEAVERALLGENGVDIITDYNGNPVLSAFGSIKIASFDWVVLAEIDEAEAFSGITKLRWTIIVLAVLIAAIICFTAIYVSKLISSPILALSKSIQRVESEGNFSISINNPYHDEVGQTSRAFDQLLKNLSTAINDSNSSLEELGRGNFDKSVNESYRGDLGKLARGVNTAIRDVKDANEASQQQALLAEESANQAKQAAEESENQARETLVIKQALDVSATAVMIADADFDIVYNNRSLDLLMNDVASDIQRALPKFDAKKLIGTNIDTFHKNPAHQRSLIAGLKDTYSTTMELSGLTFALATTPIRDKNGQFLGAVVEWQDKTAQLKREAQEKQAADENARIRQALDVSSTSAMIADKDFNIIYTNNSLNSMMKNAESDLQKVISGFNADKLIGKQMDVFHKDPSHQRALLEKLDRTYSNHQVGAGARTFSIVANPINNADGERIGTVVEWKDRTEEVAIESEIDSIIESAASGDFGKLLETENKNGFFLKISTGLNQLLETTNVALQDIIRVLSALARGDLSQSIERDYQGEFGILKNDANTTVEKLKQIMSEISEGAGEIARSAKEISAGNADLSQRTEEQASSLEETASSMEEMSTVVQKSEENAQSANDSALRSVDIAKVGNESVQRTASAMKEISASSEKISNIIGVIDEIAFQTNLLALNAAVEAARAGEQGRGFAVVAGEVRNLAQRSASAAKEIKDLIKDSVSKVGEGSRLVDDSGKTLAKIVEEIAQVSTMMEDILSSAKEQTAGIGQVSSAVSQMDQITQQNAALVEEASAASESMADQASKLDQLTSFFKA